MNKQSPKKSKNKTKTSSTPTSSNNQECNKPRNHIVKDASSQYTFTYKQFGQTRNISVNQTPDEDTWPGGALWDVGVLLAKVLVMINNPPPSGVAKKNELYVSRINVPKLWPKPWKECRVLELGCGVGLTGLVGASLGAKLSLLTDLDEVVNKVARPNVDLNKGAYGMGQKVIAVPLCWGKEEDEEICRQLLTENSKNERGSTKRKTKKKKSSATANSTSADLGLEQSTDPDIILIGDVAYQHKPGAPSHFDILLSTLLHFATTRNTTIVFGTRMRMPASMDLLEMFREHFDEVVQPPVEADELDMAFHKKNLGRNSLITIHFFKRKCQQIKTDDNELINKTI